MNDKALGLSPELLDYLCANSLREPELLQQLREETAKLPASLMQIAPDQGQFMAWLVKAIGAKRTLDIGVFTGYSSLVVALALPEGGQVVACDRDPKATEIARRYWQMAGVADRIDFRLAPALDTLDRLLADGQRDRFDFAFIDADKSNYVNYYERCLQLVRPGGTIAIDNVLWSGRVADPTDTDKSTEAIRAFNAKLYADDRIDLSLLPIADGLTLARRR
ncbi:MAG: class I SAM-dependent methyltransferase [Geitlerinemataceae cyanobacterium]